MLQYCFHRRISTLKIGAKIIFINKIFHRSIKQIFIEFF